MNLKTLLLLILLVGGALPLLADVPLEKPLPAAAPPIEAPAQPSPIGPFLLGLLLAQICLLATLPGVVGCFLLALRLFGGSLTRLMVGLMTTGGLPAVKMLATGLGLLVTLPAGLLGLSWSCRLLDHPLERSTWWIFGLSIGVVTSVFFLKLIQALARTLKERVAGKMFPGMMPSAAARPGKKRKLR